MCQLFTLKSPAVLTHAQKVITNICYVEKIVDLSVMCSTVLLVILPVTV